MAKIKLTTKNGTSYPSDLHNLTYRESVEELNLLEQKTGFEDFETDRQGEDVLCLNHTDGNFSLYEIEEDLI
jgi:hypothetical protein